MLFVINTTIHEYLKFLSDFSNFKDDCTFYQPYSLWFQRHSIPLVSDPKIYGCEPKEAVLGPWWCLHWSSVSGPMSWSRPLWLPIVYLWQGIWRSQLPPTHPYKGICNNIDTTYHVSLINLTTRMLTTVCYDLQLSLLLTTLMLRSHIILPL